MEVLLIVGKLGLFLGCIKELAHLANHLEERCVVQNAEEWLPLLTNHWQTLSSLKKGMRDLYDADYLRLDFALKDFMDLVQKKDAEVKDTHRDAEPQFRAFSGGMWRENQELPIRKSEIKLRIVYT